MKAKQFDPLDFVPSPPIARKLLAESRALTRRLEILSALSEQLHNECASLQNPSTEGREEALACPS